MNYNIYCPNTSNYNFLENGDLETLKAYLCACSDSLIRSSRSICKRKKYAKLGQEMWNFINHAHIKEVLNASEEDKRKFWAGHNYER